MNGGWGKGVFFSEVATGRSSILLLEKAALGTLSHFKKKLWSERRRETCWEERSDGDRETHGRQICSKSIIGVYDTVEELKN